MGKAAGLLLLLLAGLAQAADLTRIVVSAPGPRNISYLPVDLIPAIGADKEEGVSLKILHTGGGGVALNNMTTRNADFAVAGVPAALSLKANGGEVAVIAPVNDAPLFVLMVRSGLKGEVKRIADLKGKVIGVNTGTKTSKTTSQQLGELLLKSAGVPADAVRIVPAGQSWVEQSSLMITGAADAVVGDEPFASRLQEDGKVAAASRSKSTRMRSPWPARMPSSASRAIFPTASGPTMRCAPPRPKPNTPTRPRASFSPT